MTPFVQRAIDEVGPSVVSEFLIHTGTMVATIYADEIAANVPTGDTQNGV